MHLMIPRNNPEAVLAAIRKDIRTLSGQYADIKEHTADMQFCNSLSVIQHQIDIAYALASGDTPLCETLERIGNTLKKLQQLSEISKDTGAEHAQKVLLKMLEAADEISFLLTKRLLEIKEELPCFPTAEQKKLPKDRCPAGGNLRIQVETHDILTVITQLPAAQKQSSVSAESRNERLLLLLKESPEAQLASGELAKGNLLTHIRFHMGTVCKNGKPAQLRYPDHDNLDALKSIQDAVCRYLCIDDHVLAMHHYYDSIAEHFPFSESYVTLHFVPGNYKNNYLIHLLSDSGETVSLGNMQPNAVEKRLFHSASTK